MAMSDPAAMTRARVRSAIARDLRPVRPLWSPRRRALALWPFALALATLAALRYGLRDDADVLGGFVTWGLSGFEWLVGLTVIAIALREAVPGLELARARLAWLFAGAAAIVVAITLHTFAVHPAFVRPQGVWFMWRACLAGSLQFSVPLLAVVMALVMRAFPTHPFLTGALSGLGAGLAVDSGWRLTCEFTSPAHVFGAHALAVALVTLGGAVLASGLDRVRR
jgi:hypothetical protein